VLGGVRSTGTDEAGLFHPFKVIWDRFEQGGKRGGKISKKTATREPKGATGSWGGKITVMRGGVPTLTPDMEGR